MTKEYIDNVIKEIKGINQIDVYESLPYECEEMFEYESNHSKTTVLANFSFYSEKKNIKGKDAFKLKNTCESYFHEETEDNTYCYYSDFVPSWCIKTQNYYILVDFNTNFNKNKNCLIYGKTMEFVLRCRCLDELDKILSPYRKNTSESINLYIKKIRDRNWDTAKKERDSFAIKTDIKPAKLVKICKREENKTYKNNLVSKKEQIVIASRNPVVFERRCNRMLDKGWFFVNTPLNQISDKKRNQAFMAVFQKKIDFHSAWTAVKENMRKG